MDLHWTDTETLRLPDSPAPMQQHPAYGRTCRHLGLETRNLTLEGANEVLATAQVLLRQWPLLGTFALLSRGPVWSPTLGHGARAAALIALKGHLSQQYAGLIMTADPWDGTDPLARSGLLKLMTPFHIACLDLTLDSNQRRARQAGKWRNRLRHGEESGLMVASSPLPPRPDHWLLKAEDAQSRAKGYRRLPTNFAATWAQVNRNGTQLFTATRNGKRVAAMMFLLHGSRASYHIGWAGPEGRQCSAHNLVLWHASNWLAERGFGSIDLGTLDTETSPGLARFKLGAGATPVAIGSTWLEAPGTGLVARLSAALSRAPYNRNGQSIQSPSGQNA